MRIFVGTFFSFTLLPLTAYAQSAGDTTELPTITIYNDVGLSGQEAVEQQVAAPNAVVVIEGARLQQYSDLSIGEAIRRLPGVSFPGVNRSRNVSLRMIGPEYTQVLLDGRPLIDAASDRSFEIDRIPASMVERVEIIRSPLASMNSEGAAGTVNIITKRQFDSSSGGASIEGGVLSNEKGIGSISGWQGGQLGDLTYNIGGQFSRREVDESSDTYAYDDGGPDGGNIEDYKRRYDEVFLNGRFEYSVDDANRLTFSPTYSRSHEVSDIVNNRLHSSQTRFNRRTTDVRDRVRETIAGYLEWAHDFSPETTGKLFVDMQKGKEDSSRNSYQQSIDSSGVIQPGEWSYRESPIDIQRIAPGAILNTKWNGHELEAGFGGSFTRHDEADKRWDEGEDPRFDAGRNFGVTEDIGYAYATDSFSPTGADLLTLGARIEGSRTETTDIDGNSVSSDAWFLNPTVDYRYSLNSNLDLRAGVARTLRRPDLRDLTPGVRDNDGTIADPHSVGNPELKPESIWGIDAGIDFHDFVEGGLLSLNLFGRHFSDKIEDRLYVADWEGDDNYFAQPDNVGSGRMYGLELDGRVPLTRIDGLTLFGNLTWVHSELHDDATNTDRRFNEQPDLITNIGMEYYVDAWRTTFGAAYNRVYSYSQDIAAFDDDDDLINQHTDFNALNRLDLSVKTQFTDAVSLTLAANNILRPKDRQVLTVTDSAGGLVAIEDSTERSAATYSARLNIQW